MKLRKIMKQLIKYLLLAYVNILKRTVKLKVEGEQPKGIVNIYGFWHEDSFCMNLILDELQKKLKGVRVLVTEDSRGDYIEYLIEKCGGSTFRLASGIRGLKELKNNLQISDESNKSIALAMDGPLGPRHKAKRLPFYLSEKLGIPFVSISVSYTYYFRLFWRWDKYVVPLPFSGITVHIQNHGIMGKIC